MLRTVNNNISFNRGESVTIDFIVWNNDGTPYILPPLSNNKLQTIVAFTVYAVDGYTPVLTKYLDMFEGITSPYYDEYGNIQYCKDTAEFGYNKFTNRQVYTISGEPEDFYATEANRGKICAVKEDGVWQYYYYNEEARKPLAYEFGFSIVFTPSDTADLKSGDYKYDISVYISEYIPLDDIALEKVTKLPLVQPVVFKQQLVSPHKFLLEDSLNA